MEGIKETKEALEFVAVLATAIGEAKADGEIGIGDAFTVLPALTLAPSAFGGASLIAKEAADYTSEEIKALSAFFKAKCDLPNDKYEEYFEYAIEAALNLGKLVAGLRK